jgi:hypothetical protein
MPHRRAAATPLRFLIAGLAIMLAAPASALPAVGGLPSLPLPPLTAPLAGDLRNPSELAAPDRLLDIRTARLRDFVRANPQAIEVDDRGDPVVRGEVLVLSPSPASLAAARAAGFALARQTSLDEVDVVIAVLTAPPGISARTAIKKLRALDPAGRYDFDHVYFPAGVVGPAAAPVGDSGGEEAGTTAPLGLIDSGVDAAGPVFAGVRIEQRGFAPGGVRIAAHGTAVASLMVGRRGRFHGAAPGAPLLVADVYGDGPTGGSAEAIVQGLAWVAHGHAQVIDVSVVGPPNAALAAVIAALAGRGFLIVAPVGNDGPAAPPLYPASYPWVVAVTAVDARGKVLLEAGRATHVDFAAPGADMAAATPGGGFAEVRGSSFAAPIVAGELSRLVRGADPASAREAIATLAASAKRLGAAGDRGGRIAHGLVGVGLATPLAQLGH